MVSCLILFSLFIVNCQAKNLETVPLFVIESWDQRPGLREDLAIHSQSTREVTFDRVIECAASQNHTLIFFLEPTLSMEDLSRKDSKGTSYYNLQNRLLNGNAIFFRSSLEPYQYLVKNFPLTPFNRFDDDFLMNSISSEMFKSSKYIYVFFRDNTSGNDSRSEVLRSHDIILNKMFSDLRHMFIGPVTGIYTGMINPVILDRPKPIRRTEIESPEEIRELINTTKQIFSCDTVVYCHAKLIMILSDGVSWHPTKDLACSHGINDRKDVFFLCSFKSEEDYQVKGDIKHKLRCRFNFLYKEFPKKWVLERIGNSCSFYGADKTEKVKTLAGGYVIFNKTIPNTHGYTSTVQFNYTHMYTEQWFTKSILYFQFSPTLKNLKAFRVFNDDDIMNYKEDKYVLFTAPIISGLLISGILMSTFIWSVSMMMNINVNTKFDDSLSGSPCNPDIAQ